MVAPGFIRHDLVGTWPGVKGQSGVVDLIGTLLAGMPDLKLEIEDIFGAADRVVMRFTLHGTHRGELLGRPATGHQITISGINIYRFENTRAAETWQLADIAGLLRQLDQPRPR